MDQDKTTESTKVRIGHSLSEAEKQHVAGRRKTVLQCLKQHGISCSEDEVPNIAVLGSGGGLRAMVGLLGSLNQLKEDGLLDCIMYLCGVSGSTWCMSSLYKEPNWSSKLKTVKNNIIQRLAGTKVGWKKMIQKLMKYMEKDNFSLTDIWTALVVSYMVNEIDGDKLSEQRSNYTNNPYPIYTVIDNQCKYVGLCADPWFEITPDESGYSLTGAFVDSSCLGSQFEKGKKIKDQPEIDMLYLQGLCGSAPADRQEILKTIKEFFSWRRLFRYSGTPEMHTGLTGSVTCCLESAHPQEEGQEECELLLALMGLYVSAMEKEDPTDYINIIEDLLEDDQKIETKRIKVAYSGKRRRKVAHSVKGRRKMAHSGKKGRKMAHSVTLMASKRTISKAELKKYTDRVCNSLSDLFDENKPASSTFFLNPGTSLTPVRQTATTLCGTSVKSWINSARKCFYVFYDWIWGTTYNYLHNMTVEGVDPSVLKAKTRDYIDAGLLHNSPYFSVLRKERDIDLIISLDFSAGDPFETVNQTAKTCKALQIPFPEVAVSCGGNTEPKDFYVFKDGTEAPTVIHIPLFNGVNCKGEIKKWEKSYSTFRRSYRHSEITDLVEKAGSNIKNNKDNLLKEIENIIKEKKTSKIA
ncbi:cytosolic phospholipase A2 gamma-like [Colossoma macropomum]|uniref:cytosolic phospholipase A2 gamma-like n=1 Tax=Colossoma macropomum TaxID=42526 RepID=UPI001863FC4A|nr:cytosolic phospholipase A2 gamma-like [Colossoma macropomum]XP_036421619.1 cytosolic phospholipase A2 gamma-like [Colossoma macropomum]